VTQPTVSSAIATQLDDLGNVFLVLELCDAVVFPDMLDEGLDVTTHCIQVGVTRAKYAWVLAFRIVAVTLYYEAIGDLEDSLVAIIAFNNLPRFTGREVQVIFAMWAIGRGVGCDACRKWLVTVTLKVYSIQAV
jgi:hypothetical protein